MKYCYCNKLDKNIFRLVVIREDGKFDFANIKDCNGFLNQTNEKPLELNSGNVYLPYIKTAIFNDDGSVIITFFDDDGHEITQTIFGKEAITVSQFVLNHKCNE